MSVKHCVFIRNKVIGFFYSQVLKRIFFQIDSETVHDRMIYFGHTLGKSAWTINLTKLMFFYFHKSLEQEILGIKFSNPIGLAAGFDKNAELTDILPSVGFGFAEMGSITGEPCLGNPKPRLWRLIKSKGLVVYYGLKNDGSEAISERLKNRKFTIPIGISIAKTNSKKTVDTEQGIADYVKAYQAFADIGSYFTINISCPNSFGGQPFTDPEKLGKLLSEIEKVDIKKPTFLKLSPDLSNLEIDKILKVAEKHKISGFICSNLTKGRSGKILDSDVPEKGGISGKPQEDLSNDQIAYVYKKTKGEYILIGCGGIFSAEDAYRKIKAGASLVQLITGMIFEGPQVISEINQGLVKLLQKDGYTNISQAIGKNTTLKPS